MATPDYVPDDDTQLKRLVREGLTGYDATPDELTEPDLDSVLQTAKLRLYNKTGVSNPYSDDGLAQALLFGTAILAKDRVDNALAASWSFGEETVETLANVPAESKTQLQNWNEGVKEGLSSSSKYDTVSFSLTSNYDF